MIRTVNKATGELLEFPYENLDELAGQYDDINQQIKALERAKAKLAEVVRTMMGDEKELKIQPKLRFVLSTRHYLNYDLAVLRRVLDEDMVSLIVKPDKRRTEEHLGQWLREGVINEADHKLLKDSMLPERPVVQALTLSKD